MTAGGRGQRWSRPLVLGIVAVVLAVLGISTIAYAVTRPDANHPPVGAGLQAGAGVPAPVLPVGSTPAASPSGSPSASPGATVPPPLPSAEVVPFGAASTPARHHRTSSPTPTATRTRTPSPGSTSSGAKPTTKPTARPTTKPTTKPTATPKASPTQTLPVPLDSSPPVRVVIPAIGVDRRPIDLGLTGSGALETPTTASDLGWWDGGVAPGAMGPAVIAGHVSYNRPGVFYRLATLDRGDTIRITRKDGVTATFTVSGVREYPKDDFPTQDVYGFVDRAALRLITCGGTYDPKTRHFEENVVVYADMTSVSH